MPDRERYAMAMGSLHESLFRTASRLDGHPPLGPHVDRLVSWVAGCSQQIQRYLVEVEPHLDFASLTDRIHVTIREMDETWTEDPQETLERIRRLHQQIIPFVWEVVPPGDPDYPLPDPPRLPQKIVLRTGSG